MEKKIKTPEQIYKQNKRTAKILQMIAPYVFWACIILAGISIYSALKNSLGNVIDIINLLDSKIYTGTELQANYTALVEKWGEWTIGTGGSGFQVSFIDIGNALFSGLAITNAIMFVIWLVMAFVGGKWLLPKIAKQIADSNQDKVNMMVFKKEEKEVKANETDK